MKAKRRAALLPRDTGDDSLQTLPVIFLGFALIALTSFDFVVRDRRADTDIESGSSSE